jgi:CHAD domain-containing protein
MLLPSLLSFAELIPSQIMTQFSVTIRDQRVTAMHSLKKACVGLLKRDFDRDIRLLSRRVIWRGKAKPPTLATFLSQRIAPLALRFFAEFEFMGIEPQRLHDVRILGRRLRYELDLFQKALDGPEFRLLGTNLAEIQERLGQVHDRWTVLQFLQDFSEESRSLPESLLKKFPDLEAIANREVIQAFQESLENVARVKIGLKKWTGDRNAVG